MPQKTNIFISNAVKYSHHAFIWLLLLRVLVFHCFLAV